MTTLHSAIYPQPETIREAPSCLTHQIHLNLEDQSHPYHYSMMMLGGHPLLGNIETL